MLNLKLSSASRDKIQRAGNSVGGAARMVRHSTGGTIPGRDLMAPGWPGDGPAMVTLSNAVTRCFAEDVRGYRIPILDRKYNIGK